jgi:hypothetical protein
VVAEVVREDVAPRIVGKEIQALVSSSGSKFIFGYALYEFLSHFSSVTSNRIQPRWSRVAKQAAHGGDECSRARQPA